MEVAVEADITATTGAMMERGDRGYYSLYAIVIVKRVVAGGRERER